MAGTNIQQSASVAKGSQSFCRVDGETMLGASPDCLPKPKSRVLDLDVTGFYVLHVDDKSVNPPLFLQLNQVGHSAVGWISKTPSFVKPIQSLPDWGIGSAVLVADLEPDHAVARPTKAISQPATSVTKGATIFYHDVNGIEGHDPTEVLDPHDPFKRTSPDSSVLMGWIGFEILEQPGSGDWDGVVPRLRATLFIIRGADANGDEKLQTFVFDMFMVRTRVAERTIGAQGALEKQYLIARHRVLVPPSFYSEQNPSGATWQAAATLFSQTGDLANLIKAYEAIRSEPQSKRDDVVGKIKELLRSKLGSWQFGDDKQVVSKLLNAKLVSKFDNVLAVDVQGNSHNPVPKTFVGWLSDIGSNEIAMLPPDAKVVAPGAIPSLEAYPREFRWLCAGEMFRYSFTFSMLSPAEEADLKRRMPRLPDQLIKKVPDLHVDKTLNKKIGLSATGGVFKVVISASHAFPTTDGSPPQDSSFKSMWSGKVFFGVYGDAGFALTAIPDLPDKLDVDTSVPLQPEDFDGAQFLLKGFALGMKLPFSFTKSVKIGGTTQIMTIYVKKEGSTIEGATDDGGKLTPTAVSGGLSPADIFKKMRKGMEKGALKTLKDTIMDGVSAGASIGGGAFMLGRPDVKKLTHPAGRRTLTAGDGRTVAAFFNLDSADINDQFNDWDMRFLLETALAVDLALFTGTPGIDCVGHASPEGTKRHNLILSKLRAAAVRQAIIDTAIIDPDIIGSDGLGDELSQETKVPGTNHFFTEPDPDVMDKTKSDEFAKKHTEESQHWPEFRKVVIEWWGDFFLEVITVPESDEDAPQNQPQNQPQGAPTPAPQPAPQPDSPNKDLPVS
jgi:outer membrane protein OmpA-like peptidoglycan-associated protein